MSSKPTSNEKYQAGESYADASKQTKAFSFDPATIAADMFKECISNGLPVSLPELTQLIKGLLSKGEPVDDRKG